MSKQSTLRNMVLCLFLVTLVSSALMGAAYVLTYEAIALQQSAKINNAIAAVVPAFDNSPSAEMLVQEEGGKQVKVYPIKKDGKMVGYAVEASTTNGYNSDPIVLMIGFLPDGTIYKSTVVSHGETPGLGDKMEPSKGDFSLQFNGKHPSNFKLAVKQDGGDVDAITASTISSRAFCGVIDQAYKILMQMQEDGTIGEKGGSDE